MRYIVRPLIALGLVILVIILIIKAFSGHGSPTSPSTTPKSLSSYAGTDINMQLTIESGVNADQNHREVEITVGSTNTQVNIFQGYQRTLLNTANYENNENAYSDFLRALDLNGYTLGNSSSTLTNEQGYCANGIRYIFEVVEDGQDLERYWSSSCGIGNFKGNTFTIVGLFKRQVPDYDKFTSGVNFND